MGRHVEAHATEGGMNPYRTRQVSQGLLRGIETCRRLGENVKDDERDLARYRHGDGRHERQPVTPVPLPKTPKGTVVFE
jgi:hypothetical protein